MRRYAVRAGLLKGTHFILDPRVGTHQVTGLYEREIASAVRHLSRLSHSAIDIGHEQRSRHGLVSNRSEDVVPFNPVPWNMDRPQAWPVSLRHFRTRRATAFSRGPALRGFRLLSARDRGVVDEGFSHLMRRSRDFTGSPGCSLIRVLARASECPTSKQCLAEPRC